MEHVSIRRDAQGPLPELSRRQRHECLIGKSLLVFETETLRLEDMDMLDSDDQKLRLRKIVSLQVRSPKTGKNIDLLRLICPNGTAVFMSEDRLENYCHAGVIDQEAVDIKSLAKNKRASLYLTCPPLESDVDLAILFHEAGHSTQWLDAHIHKLLPYTRAGKDAFTEKCLYSFNRLPFGLAREIIDLCPELEGERDAVDAFEDAYAAMEQRLSRTREAIRDLRVRQTTLETEIDELAANADQILRKELSPAIARLEEAIARYGAHPPSRGRRPFTEEEKMALQAELTPYGIFFTESHVHVNDLIFFIDWLKNYPLAKTKWVGEVEHAEEEGALVRPFISTQHGEHVLSVEIRKGEEPFKRSFIALQEALETVTDRKKKADAISVKKSALYREDRIILHTDQVKQLNDVISYPLRAIERDATWRALLWFRLLRDEHDVHFLEQSSTTIQKALAKLLDCLDTYGAKVDRYKKVANPSPQSWKPPGTRHPTTRSAPVTTRHLDNK